MAKNTKNTTATKTATIRLYENTKSRLQRVVRKKADLEGRDVTDLEIADKYVLLGVKRDERKLKII